MKTLPLLLSATMATALVSCNQSPPPGPSAMGDPLSSPASGSTQTPAPQVDFNSDKYPLAVRTPQPEIVLSPYKPYNKVRVDPKKFSSGDLAEDPDNRGKYFRVP